MDGAKTAADAANQLSAVATRALGCLIEKEFTTPDVYPLSLNALVNACNQRNNRDPVMEVGSLEVEAALEELRLKHLASVVSAADARVAKYRHKIDSVYPMGLPARAVMADFLLRGPQTAAAVRANAARMYPQPEGEAFDAVFAELTERPAGPLMRKLPRQPGQKEARWCQLLTGEPPATIEQAEPEVAPFGSKPSSSNVDARVAALEAEVARLREELARLRAASGTPGC